VSSEDVSHALQAWREAVEARAAGLQRRIQRGTKSSTRAPGAWRAEGRDQCAGQLDIWQCIEAARADRGQTEQQDGE